ncbi:MAG: hypothetical protein ACK559_26695 [bacterium]
MAGLPLPGRGLAGRAPAPLPLVRRVQPAPVDDRYRATCLSGRSPEPTGRAVGCAHGRHLLQVAVPPAPTARPPDARTPAVRSAAHGPVGGPGAGAGATAVSRDA